MKSMTTAATAPNLSTLLDPTPTIPSARLKRVGSLAARIGLAALAVWLAATLAVLIGRWQPPVPTSVAGRAALVEPPSAGGR
jgi:hypothetical protein